MPDTFLKWFYTADTYDNVCLSQSGRKGMIYRRDSVIQLREGGRGVHSLKAAIAKTQNIITRTCDFRFPCLGAITEQKGKTQTLRMQCQHEKKENLCSCMLFRGKMFCFFLRMVDLFHSLGFVALNFCVYCRKVFPSSEIRYNKLYINSVYSPFIYFLYSQNIHEIYET